MADLDTTYREEGWGIITDRAFHGRVRPQDVESMAREVARWAHEETERLQAQINELGKTLATQDRDLVSLQKVADSHARLLPKYQGTVAALDLERIAHKRTAVEAARNARDAASYRLKISEAELALCEARSRTGDRSIPTSIEARPLRSWLDENRSDDDG